MDNIPSLDDLLNYGDDYQYPNLIMSDYFRIDKNKKREENKNNQNDEETQEQSSEQQNDELKLVKKFNLPR